MTQNCYFRLTTTLLGLNVTDTWLLMHFHRLFPFTVRQQYSDSADRMVPIKAFVGYLSAQLMKKADVLDEQERMKMKRVSKQLVMMSSEDSDMSDMTTVTETTDDKDKLEDFRFAYTRPSGHVIVGCSPVEIYRDGNGMTHTLAKFPVVQTGKRKKKRSRVQSCIECGKETTYFCYECKTVFCYVSPSNPHGHGRKCFCNHIPTCTSSRISTPL